MYAADLAANQSFRSSLMERIAEGLPVWAECGGLMYLSRSLKHGSRVYPMVGALPIDVLHTEKPDGHGYVRGVIDRANPFFESGFELKGHEFHYSKIVGGIKDVVTVCALERGKGVGMKRDGIHCHNVVATYTHLHALGTPELAEGFMEAI